MSKFWFGVNVVCMVVDGVLLLTGHGSVVCALAFTAASALVVLGILEEAKS